MEAQQENKDNSFLVVRQQGLQPPPTLFYCFVFIIISNKYVFGKKHTKKGFLVVGPLRVGGGKTL